MNQRLKGALNLALGILFMILGAMVQSLTSFEWTFIWTFNHNSFYHLLTLLGMWIIFSGVKKDSLQV